MHTIYIDVLIILNIYVNFILILATAKITRSKIKKTRAIISAVYGSLYSLMILLPSMNIFLNILIKLFAVVTIIIIAFGYINIKRLIINTICFFTVNFIFGGVIFAVYIFLKPSFIHFNNTYFYIDFSLLILIFVTAFLYTALSLFRFFTDKLSIISDDYKIIIKYNKKTLVLDALPDTGNSLVDFFTGKPVIICSSGEFLKIAEIFEKSEDYLKLKGFRLIPYSTVGNCGMIPVFTPDEVLIVNQDGYCKKVDVLIGIQNVQIKEKRAIFNPNLLKF